ncbi:hypothetical protein ACWFRB_13845 [Rhodococcus sp. NPDC055112]
MVQPAERNRARGACTGASLAMFSLILAGVLLAGGCGREQPTQSGAESQYDVTTSGPNLLPQEVLVALDVVQNYFPEMTRQDPPGANTSAAGIPSATRMTIFEGDEGRKVTISVDRYPSSGSAAAAFTQAIGRSEAVQGFIALQAPADVGDRAFAGIVSQGDDTHIGYGALAGEYVIGVTSAGYPATAENTTKLSDLTREAVEKAETG